MSELVRQITQLLYTVMRFLTQPGIKPTAPGLQDKVTDHWAPASSYNPFLSKKIK